MKISGKFNAMKNVSQVAAAVAAWALILNATISYGAVPEAETQRLNDSSAKEKSVGASATPPVPDASRNVLQLKDADELMGKYLQLADLTIDEFTPEAIEAIFGIKFGPRQDTGGGGFAVGFNQPSPYQYPLGLFYSKRSYFGILDVYVRWPDYSPPICVDFLKLKAELERHGWVISGPSSQNTHGGPAGESFIRSESDKKWYVYVDVANGNCVINFGVRHEFAVEEKE